MSVQRVYRKCGRNVRCLEQRAAAHHRFLSFMRLNGEAGVLGGEVEGVLDVVGAAAQHHSLQGRVLRDAVARELDGLERGGN